MKLIPTSFEDFFNGSAFTDGDRIAIRRLPNSEWMLGALRKAYYAGVEEGRGLPPDAPSTEARRILVAGKDGRIKEVLVDANNPLVLSPGEFIQDDLPV